MMYRQRSDVMTFVGWCVMALAVLYLDSCGAYKVQNGSYFWDMKRLHNYLMEDYLASIRPVNHSGETVTVNLTLVIGSIEDLDEKNQAFIFNGHIIQSWTDARLVWNSTDFNNIDFMQIPMNELWRPEVTVINSKDENFVLPTNHEAFISSDGMVISSSPVSIGTHCDLDLSEFPFDEHVCQVLFISWNLGELAINLKSPEVHGNDSRRLAVHGLVENHEWELKHVTVERREKRLKYEISPKITYSFTIRRRSTFATHLFVGPSVILCILMPAVFLLPPGSGEKMMFGIGVLIADTLLLGQLIDYIPTAHPNIPFIAKYFLVNIIMASLSLAISAVIVGFWDKSTSRMSGPPAFFRLVVLNQMATLLCIKKNDLLPEDEISSVVAVEINPEGENTTESTSGVDPATEKRRRFMANYLRNTARSEWRQLAVVFDRLFFLIYCVILAILTLSFARYM